MGTHPIFESDFDCLTDSKSKKKSQWPLSKLQSSRKLATMKSRTIAEAKTKLRRSRLTLVETKPLIRETKVVVDNRNRRKGAKGDGETLSSCHSRRQPCLYKKKQVDFI